MQINPSITEYDVQNVKDQIDLLLIFTQVLKREQLFALLVQKKRICLNWRAKMIVAKVIETPGYTKIIYSKY